MHVFARLLALTVTFVAALAVSARVAAQEAPLLRLGLRGAGSCAAAACHNAGDAPGYTGREYALALPRDPAESRMTLDRHARAYDVLLDPRSRRIERNLRRLPRADDARPEKDVLCLRCHVQPNFDRHPVLVRDGVPQFRVEDGVSCEACHGPAERWLATHFRPGWRELPPSARLARGQIDTPSLVGRVGVCVDCHVGAPGMDVNHDLIAAGHPRLNFEFSGFHFVLHKHWDYARDINPAADPRGRPDFEARAWLVGQVASARADLLLLADRAEASAHDPQRPWPEFAAYDCFACHHDLKGQSWRQAQGFGKDKAGRLRQNAWYTALLPEALADLGGPSEPLGALLDGLRREMEAPRPDRGRVAEQARRAAALLDARLVPLGDAPLPVDAMLRRLARAAPERATSWDGTAQVYLALSALVRADRDMGRPAPLPPLELPRLRDLLLFPAGYNSPVSFDPVKLRQALDPLR